MSDDHLMKNIIAQAEIIKELNEKNHILMEALEQISTVEQPRDEIWCNHADLAKEALSKVKLTK